MAATLYFSQKEYNPDHLSSVDTAALQGGN